MRQEAKQHKGGRGNKKPPLTVQERKDKYYRGMVRSGYSHERALELTNNWYEAQKKAIQRKAGGEVGIVSSPVNKGK